MTAVADQNTTTGGTVGDSINRAPGLRVEGVWKQFGSLHFGQGWGGWLWGQKAENPTRPALRDIHLTVHQGEILGIVGPNGSGKTTLLRLIAGVSQPSQGTIWSCGSVAALLDLSGGFHPNLTGWQNLFLGASLAGLTRKQVRDRMGEMVDFSGLAQRDMDRPVREWSAGMVARLGFAIAVGVDPSVIVVDEVLAVGDAGFQARCAQRLLQFRDEGKTMIMVSHVTAVLRNVADRLLWLDHGEVRALGPVAEVADAYEAEVRRRISHRRQEERPASSEAMQSGTNWSLRAGDPVWAKEEELGHLSLPVEVSGPRGANGSLWLHFSLTMETGVLLDEGWLEVLPDGADSDPDGPIFREFRLDSLPLMPGRYELELQLCHEFQGNTTFPDPCSPAVTVEWLVPGSRMAADQYPVDMPIQFRLITGA